MLLVGILGNLDAADLVTTLRTAPALCADGGWVVWPLGRAKADGTGQVRELLAESGFVEERFKTLDRGGWPSVGLVRLTGTREPLPEGQRLFEFVR